MTISVCNLARSIQNRQTSALEVISQTLAEIEAKNRHLNCFTDILQPRALAQAQKIDQAIANGEPVGVLAGIPFAVKNLFDIKGIVTLAGSKINRDHPAAGQDAIAIQTLEAAGAVLVGATNMDEYAYGFVTENAHYRATPNPRDPSLHYSPTGKNLIVRTSQKTDCFSARSLDELLAKAFEDFPKSS